MSFSTFGLRCLLLGNWRDFSGPCYLNMISILFRAIPGCLGSLGLFKTHYSCLIEQGQRHSATKRALATGRKTAKALARKISHWFLRRTKALIKEQLPKKDDRVFPYLINSTFFIVGYSLLNIFSLVHSPESLV